MKTRLFLSSFLLLGLAACGGAKEQLGLVREAPDEFSVVKRAPLELPPDYYLRPPVPGAQRPQEQAPEVQAQETVFGAGIVQDTQDPRQVSTGEAILLDQTGAANVQPNIRQIVDSEAETFSEREKPVAKRLLNIGRDPKPEASVVDPKAEADRIKQNIESEKPITEGETPTKIE